MTEFNHLLQRIKKVRVSDSVVEQIISLIEDGKLQVGDQLPGERELVNQFQVARASVREALRILEFKGIIEVRSGKGAFVIGDPTTIEREESVRRWFQEHATEVMDILEVREALESRAVKLAAQRATPEQIDEINQLMDRMEESLKQRELDTLVHLDRSFHLSIAKASGIPVLLELVDIMIEAMVNPRRSLMLLPDRAEKSYGDHRNITNAITQRDAPAAEQAMVKHIESVRKAIADLSPKEQ